MFRFFLPFYTALYSAGVVCYLVLAGWRRVSLGKRTSLSRRIRPKLAPKAVAEPIQRVWVHAVSVGEVNAVRPLISGLREAGLDVVVSTTTPTGQQVAQAQWGEASVFYFPMDWKIVCRSFFNRVQPDLVLLAETEIWPNFLAVAKTMGIPVLIINGRVSDHSYHQYLKGRFFFRPVLQLVTQFCMQSKIDKERILAIGAPSDRVNWVGNLKYDYSKKDPPGSEELRQLIGSVLKPSSAELLWLCGSTKPGEEVQLAKVFASLQKDFPSLRILIAPRHPHRAQEVGQILEQSSISFELRSRLSASGDGITPPQALILDTVGELAQLYDLADLVFMGGSLVPTGGQNVIEPAAAAKPILFGPSMSNFREIAKTFVEAYAALQVASSDELEQRLRDLIKDPDARKWLGKNARKVIRDNQGAVRRTLELITPHLSNAGRQA